MPETEESIDLTPGVVWTDAQLAVVRDLTARAVRAQAAVGRVEVLANTLAATAAQCRAEATRAATIGGQDRWEREAQMCQREADAIHRALDGT